MVSLITKALLIVQLILAAGLFFILRNFAGIQNGWVALLLGIGIVALIRMIITGNNFLLVQRYRCSLPDHCRLNCWKACLLYLEEFKSTMISSSWYMPFCRLTHYHVPEARSLPVLLIHGYGCNSGYWHSMSRKLRAARIPYHAVNLEPVFGSIESFIPAVHQAVAELCRQSGQEQVIIVAHSMGGLVARAYLCMHGDENKIAKIITLGTPHHGTGLAHFGIGDNSLQMRWLGTTAEGGPGTWLQALAARENPMRYALFVSIYSYHDNIIAPQKSSYLPGARNIALHGIGHVALGLNPRVQALVINEIIACKPLQPECNANSQLLHLQSTLTGSE